MIKPQQKLPYKSKNKEWRKNTYDYYSERCVDAVDKAKALRLYRLANGQLDEKEYTSTTNPLNETRPHLMGYPAKLKNYDIITPNLNTLLGDKMDRFVRPIVFARNSNYDNIQIEFEKQRVTKLAQQMFVAKSRELGVPFGEQQITESLENIAKRKKKLINNIAMQGQDAIDYIIETNEIIRNFNKGFLDYLVLAMIFSYKDVHDDEIYYEIISALNLRYLCSPHQDFIEDGEAVAVMHFLSINEIYDRLQGIKDFDNNKELKNWLDQQVQAYDNTDISFQNATDAISAQYELFNKVFGHYPQQNNRQGIQVEHLMWRSFVKKAVVSSLTITGEVVVNEYDEDYIPLPGEQVEWQWKDEIWEGYKIGDQFHVGIERVAIASGDKPKLLYNGRNAQARYSEPQSITKKGEPYQKKYNIVAYKAEETLAKNLDNLIIFPLGLIPNKEGWDENTIMYYARALSFLFVNDQSREFINSINGLKALNLSNLSYILSMYNIMDTIKMQWDEVCGINPQRKGNISASAGKGTTEQAMVRSYVINEALFAGFEEWETREYQGFLDLSRFAYSQGKKAHFLRRDGTPALLNIGDPTTYVNADLGIFVKRDIGKLKELKANAQAFIQNSSMPSMVAKLIGTDNYHEIVTMMDDLEEQMMGKAQQQQQQQIQLEQAALLEEQKSKQQELEYKYYKTDADNLRAERVAIITSLKQSLDAIQPAVDNPSGLKEGSEMLSMFNERQKEIKDSFIKLKELEQKDEDLRLKEKEINNNRKSDIEANKTALKNKVSGEK